MMQGGASVFVGRRQELSLLESARNAPGLVLISGEAGVGKSRLLQEFTARCRLNSLVGRPDPMGVRPYGLIIGLLEQLARVVPQNEGVGDLIEGLDGFRLGIEPPARRMAAEIRGWVGTIPVDAIVCEDLHRADELSLAVLARLVYAARDDGLLYLGSWRTGEVMPATFNQFREVLIRDRLLLEIEVPPMPAEDARQLLVESGALGVLGDQVASEIIARSEGIPFFLEELAEASSSGAMPRTVSLAVSNRLDRLQDGDRRVLEAASLFSRDVVPEILSAALEVSDEDVAQALGAGVKVGLLEEESSRLYFRHQLTAEAVRDSIPDVERRRIHRRLASAMEQSGPADHASLRHLADQWFLAGDLAAASAGYVETVRNLLSQGSNAEARRAAEFALEECRYSRHESFFLASLAEVEGRVGAYERAQELFRAAIARSGDEREAFHHLLRMASFASRGDMAEARRLIDEAISLAERTGDQEMRATALVKKGDLLARFSVNLAPLAEAREYLVQGQILAESAGLKAMSAEALDALAWLEVQLGNLAAAKEPSDAACNLANDLDINELAARTQSNAAIRLALQGCGDEALEALSAARNRLGKWDTYAVQACDHMKLWTLWQLGRPEEAERLAVVLDPTPFATGWGRVCRAWSSTERDAEWIAESIISDWWDEFGGDRRRESLVLGSESMGREEHQLVLCELLSTSLSEAGHDNSTVVLAQKFLETCAGTGPHSEATALVLFGRTQMYGNPQVAVAALEGFESDPLLSRYPLWHGLALEVQGVAAQVMGDTTRAQRLLFASAELLRGAQNGSDQARVRRRIAETMTDLDPSVAVEQAKLARTTAAEVGGTREVRNSEALLRSLGVHRRAGRPKGTGLKKGDLSAREGEVATLVAAGLSNDEIAKRLFLSKRTVENHIARAQRRLGVRGRAGLAAWAAKRGLV